MFFKLVESYLKQLKHQSEKSRNQFEKNSKLKGKLEDAWGVGKCLQTIVRKEEDRQTERKKER